MLRQHEAAMEDGKGRKRDKLAGLLKSPNTKRKDKKEMARENWRRKSASGIQVPLATKGGALRRPTQAQADSALKQQQTGIHAIDDEGATALHRATRLEDGKSCKTIRSLAKKGADVHAKDFRGLTPLHYAAGAGNWKACKLLLYLGADVKAQANDNSVPLNLLAKSNFTPTHLSLQVLAALMGASALLVNHPIYRLDRRRETPLHQAAARGREYLLVFFLLNGADPSAVTESGDTPLHYALGTNNLQVAKLLLQYEADPYAKDKSGNSFVSLVSSKLGWEEALAEYLPKAREAKDVVGKSRRSMLLNADDAQVLALALNIRCLLANEQEARESPGLLEAGEQMDKLMHVLTVRFAGAAAATSERKGRRSKKKSGSGQLTGSTSDEDSDEEKEEELAASTVNLASLPPVVELVTSEERLIAYLEQAQMVYIDKLENASYLNEADKSLLLSNFSLIYNTFTSVSRRLSDYLTAAKADASVSLAATLTQLPTYLKFIKPYCHGFEEVNEKIFELMESNSKFIGLQEEGLELLGFKLEVLLIMPIQRVMRYPMMLEAILKEVPENHPDLVGISEVWSDFKSLADMIDREQEQVRRRRQVRTIMGNLGGLDFELAQAARFLVFEGTVEIAMDDDETKARQLYLFNDLMVLAIADGDEESSSKKKKSSKYAFLLERSFSLEKAFILLLPENTDSLFEFALQFCYVDEGGEVASLSLISRSAAMRNVLHEKLTEALSLIRNGNANHAYMAEKSEQQFATIEGSLRVMKGAMSAKAHGKLQGSTLYLYRTSKSAKWSDRIPITDYKSIVPDVHHRSLMLHPKDHVDGGIVKLTLSNNETFTQWMIELAKQLKVGGGDALRTSSTSV